MPNSINIFGLRFLDRPDAHYLVFLLSLCLLLPSVFVGFFADDFSHYVLIEQKPELAQPDNLSLLHLFSFTTTDTARSETLMSHSLIPWWTDPDFSMVFFRPLAELASFVDYSLWPNSPELMHIHSLLWWLLIMVLSWQVFSKLLDKPLALLALLLLAVDAAHGFTVAWIANRNALMAQTFSLLALLFFMQYHQTQRYAYLLYSTLAVAASLLSAEAGMSVGVLLAAYVLFYSKRSWSWRALSLLPALLVFISWLTVYQIYDYGVSGNNLYYVDPISAPLSYFQAFPERLLAALNMLFNPLPMYFIGNWEVANTVCSVVFLLLLGGYCFVRREPHLWFAAFIVLLSVVPAACTNMQERNLIYAAWAVAIILADALLLLAAKQNLFSKVAVTVLFFGHILLSSVLLLGMSYAPGLLASPAISQAKELDLSVNEPVVLLGVPLLQASFLTPIRRYLGLADAGSLINLSTAAHFDWKVLSDNQWIISHADGLLSEDDALVRDFADNGFHGGEIFTIGDFLIEVLSITPEHYPAVIKVTYSGDKNLKWLVYNSATQTFNDLGGSQSYSQ